MGKGVTALVLDPFLEGVGDAGAEIELFYTQQLKINPCQGDLACWLKTPGECFQMDDMQTLYPLLRDADVWVFATPVYVDGMSGPMKNVLDRTIALMEPFYELCDGHCRHPMRENVKRGKAVLISSCGYWEMDNFDPLLAHIEAYCRNAGREFAGALVRPHGAQLRRLTKKGIPVDDVFEAAREAGRQLVRDGEMTTDTLKIVSRELVPLEEHVQTINRSFQRALDATEGK
jgi:multimeric flavodoxin WrbA